LEKVESKSTAKPAAGFEQHLGKIWKISEQHLGGYLAPPFSKVD
jgi:hypothetical protein